MKKTNFVKWNDLNQFHEVVKSLQHNRLYQVLLSNDYKINYGLKIKLHGTNAAVRIEQDGKVIAQKRSSDLIGNADNAGFRVWVEANEAYFSSLAKSDCIIIIYGEWAGPGVQTGVSVSAIPKKHFFPFAMDSHKDNGEYCRLYDPTYMEHFLGNMPDDMIVIPWHDKIEIDFASKETTEKTLAKLNALTESVGENDPFIEEVFDTKGCGEGFVCYPLLGEAQPGVMYLNGEAEHFSHFNFKAKSEHHRVNKTKAAVNFDPEKFANKNRFADAFCTEARMEQGLREFVPETVVRTMQQTSHFIKWVCSDVFKESQTEQGETDVPWSELSKTIAARAAIWYKARISSL